MTEVQYITDAKGERTAVILPIDEYREIMERIRVEVDSENIEVSDDDVDIRLAKIMELSKDSPEVSRNTVFAALSRDP
jgi:hypothetical protein